jgi:hypothetical protein
MRCTRLWMPLVMMLVLPVAGSAPTAVADRTICDRFATASVSNGRYLVQQDEWNSSLPQCIDVRGSSWTITRARFDLPTDGPPATFPSVYRGCHWGTCTTISPLPIEVGALTRATSSWSTTLVPSGAYDVAYDLWTNASPRTSSQPDGSEIMIWLSSRGGVRPAGSLVGRVRIDHAAWNVWTTRMPSWNYVAYQRVRRTSSVADLDVRRFVADSVRRGITDPSWYLIAAEAGFEIWRGGRGLATNAFSFHATVGP